MEDFIELPTMKVRDWIADAARQCSYSDDDADLLGYCAWWLENRGIRGVLRACVYLLVIHGGKFTELQPIRREDRLVCLCPITCGLLIASRAGENPAEFADWTGGIMTADPVLMAPIIARALEYKFNVHLRFYDQHIVFFKEGISILSESLAALYMTDPKGGIDTVLRIVESDRDEVTPTLAFTYRKKDILSVPKHRYLEGGGFRFD
jgi:hypothetical protein